MALEVEVLFRAPLGEEMSAERLDRLVELGLDDATVLHREPGFITLVLSLEDDEWECEMDERLEILLEEMPDLDFVEMEIVA